MILKKDINSRIFFLFSILLNLLLIVLVFANISEKQIYTYFNSDTLYLPSVYKDVIIDKSGFKGWNLNGAPNFLPDMGLFFIIRSFFDHFIPACFTFSLVQVLIILILFPILYKRFFPKITYYQIGIGNLLMSLFLLVTLINNDFVYTFYLLSISYHTGAFVMFLIASIFISRYIKTEKTAHLYFILGICTISIINDRLFLILFSFPLYSLIILLFSRINGKSKIIKLLIINTASIVLGLFFFRMLRLSGYIHIISLSWKVFNFKNIVPSLSMFLQQHTFYLKQLDVRSIINILCLLSIVIHLIILVRKYLLSIKNETQNKVELIYLLLFCSSFLIVIATPIVNGSYVSWAILRYNIYSLYLGVFSFSYLFFKLYNKLKISQSVIAWGIFLIIIVSIFFHSNISRKSIKSNLNYFFTYYPKQVENIDNISEQYSIKYGVAEYWTAKYITMFSKKDVRVYTVFDDLSIWYHVTNKNWYYKNGKGAFANPEFNFLIKGNIKNETIKENLNLPIDTLSWCNDTILVFNEFEFDSKTRKPVF